MASGDGNKAQSEGSGLLQRMLRWAPGRLLLLHPWAGLAHLSPHSVVVLCHVWCCGVLFLLAPSEKLFGSPEFLPPHTKDLSCLAFSPPWPSRCSGIAVGLNQLLVGGLSCPSLGMLWVGGNGWIPAVIWCDSAGASTQDLLVWGSFPARPLTNGVRRIQRWVGGKRRVRGR